MSTRVHYTRRAAWGLLLSAGGMGSVAVFAVAIMYSPLPLLVRYEVQHAVAPFVYIGAVLLLLVTLLIRRRAPEPAGITLPPALTPGRPLQASVRRRLNEPNRKGWGKGLARSFKDPDRTGHQTTGE